MNIAPQPAVEPCARCGAPFHCGRDDALPCACHSVSLDAATLASLRAGFNGCLCLSCLRQLAAGGAAVLPPAPGA